MSMSTPMSISTPAPPDYDDEFGRSGGGINDGVSVSSEVMVASVAFFFFIVVLVFVLHIYAKWRWAPLTAAHHRAAAHSRRLVFGPDYDLIPRRGLDPAVLNSLPVHVFVAKDAEDGIECAVCLSEVAEGEKARLLPKCNHGFHLECIDMWFASHSTCPLCRNPVRLQQQEPEVPATGSSPQATNLPSTVLLFYGDQQDLVTAGGGGGVPAGASSQQSASAVSESLVIDIPSPVPDVIPAADGKLPAAEAATTPLTARLRSFKRMLSREKRAAGCSVCGSCSNGDDVEQGLSGEATPTKVGQV